MLKKKGGGRKSPAVNAGSMADIAFLLLIFFLVTTTIDVDKGISIKLPPWSDEKPESQKMKTRNVFSVLVNAKNQLLVRGELMLAKDIRSTAKEFISNPNRREDYAVAPTQAIISLKNDRGTNYKTYLQVYNELKAAYSELWDELSQKEYGKPYGDNLSDEQKKSIRKKIPFVLSEAEPADYADK